MTPANASQPTLDDIADRLGQVGQEQLLTFADTLDETRRRALLGRIAALDLDRLGELASLALSDRSTGPGLSDLAPAPYYPIDLSRRAWDRARFRAAGEAVIRAGEVAALTVAGGQGSRLGFDGPKGCFPAAVVSGKTLFQMLAEQILAASRAYSVAIPWCVMTSPLNHDATVDFFQQREHFGLDPSLVTFFQQGALPCFDDRTGRVLLARPDEPATSPDGHGGSLRALFTTGCVEKLQSQGVEHLSYVQIDNPLVRVIDPVFIGLHATADDSSAEMSSKMIAKADAAERVGVFCQDGGQLRVIEYSDLPDELAGARAADGSLRFNAGSPAIHMISLDFLQQLNEAPDGFALPLRRAHKKVAHVDLQTGRIVEPTEPNAIKLETFVFDALPLCERSIVLETDRMEFAPIKNATGPDSPETSRALQTLRAARWLQAVGVRIAKTPAGAPDCALEISPLTALEPGDLGSVDLPGEIRPGQSLAL